MLYKLEVDGGATRVISIQMLGHIKKVTQDMVCGWAGGLKNNKLSLTKQDFDLYEASWCNWANC